MKKIYTITLAALALLAVSCNKELEPKATVPQEAPVATIEKTFTVNAPGSGTKTELSGTKTVLWSEGDKISIISASSGSTYTFTLSEGAGTATAKFQGSIPETDATGALYALYPASATINKDDAKYPLSSGYITINSRLDTDVPAVLGGFSPAHALMVGEVDEDGIISFNHGMAYFKITVGQADIASINFKITGAPIGGRPSFSTSTFTTADVQAAQRDIKLSGNAPLQKDGVYYLPVTVKSSNLGTLTLMFTNTDGESASISTQSLSKVKPEEGKIYDLGSPVVSFEPELSADAVVLNADATSGSITYEITNPKAGGTMSAELKETSDWLTVGAVSDGSVALTASVNTASSRYATVVLTYTYGGSKTVSTEVSVTQKGAAGASEDYVWNFSSSEWQDAFTDSGTKNTNITNWNISLNGLTWNSVQASKWNTMTLEGVEYYYIQVGGASKVNNNDRVFSFSTEQDGTVTVKASNTGDSSADRNVLVKDSTGTEQSKNGGVPSSSPTELTFFTKAGKVQVYVSASLRIYSIEFHS